MSNTENSYQETDLGNVSPHPADEYDPEVSYEYLDVVNYKGGSYICRVEDGTVTGGCAGAREKYRCLAVTDTSGRSHPGIHCHAR